MNEDYNAEDDFAKSLEEGYRAIRERKAAGGPGWEPKMTPEDAEEYTESLGQIAAGSWRQIALAKRLGVPKALGLSTKRWVNERLGGYVRMSIAERRGAVKELTAEGHSNVAVGKILGVDEGTIRGDRASENSELNGKKSNENKADDNTTSENSEPLDTVAALAANDAVQKQIQIEAKKAEKQAASEAARAATKIDDGCTVNDLNALIAADKKFSVIYADPPWEFKVYSGKGKQRSAERYYDTASLDDIKALPIGNLAANDCALLLWCVMPEIPGALEVIRAWGFEYKTVAFTWVKQNKSGDGLFWGMGYWTRANAELCLLATKGSPKRQAMDVHQVILSPVGEHSRKPDEAQVRIERLLPGPYLELFGRRATPNWTVWGNQITRSLFHQSIPEFTPTEVQL